MALLDSLEVSEVMFSKLERTLRVDTEFYTKENLLIENFIKRNKYSKLTDLVKVSDGNHMSISEKFIDSGVPYYRGQDIHSFFIENASPICIDEQTFNEPVMKRSHLKKGDVLLSIVGTIGKLGLVYTDNKATCSCKLAILRPSNTINAEFLSIFLSSKYGYNQVKKYTRGAVQMGLILEDFDQLLIPSLSQSFQTQIEKLVKLAHSKLEESKTLYTSAEQLLLKELGLDTVSFAGENTPQRQEALLHDLSLASLSLPSNYNIKSFKDSFLATGRLDAEYYQRKYEELEKKIKEYKEGFCTLNDLIFIKKSIETGSDAYNDNGIPYVRVSNLTKFGITTPDICISKDYYNKNQLVLDTLKLKKDTILLSKDGSIGIAYKVSADIEMITSGALLHLTIKDKNKFLPDCLALILNSEVVQKQAERDSGGSIIVHWRVSEIENVIIPLLDFNIQTEISSKVQESFFLRAESDRLLALAKEMVEVAIEKGEAEALQYLEQDGQGGQGVG